MSSCNPNGGCTSPPPACPVPVCTQAGNSYIWQCDSPVIIDVEGRGFHLTDAANGVPFDFTGDGRKEQVAWTDPTYGNAWLALDRNGNGIIDDAGELFGNFTPQPKTGDPNGFLALAVFDTPSNGGDGDGYIMKNDRVFSQLRLWTDANHNVVSEADELKTLAESGVVSIALKYTEGNRRDEYGKVFRYRSHIFLSSSPIFEKALGGSEGCRQLPVFDLLRAAMGSSAEASEWKVILLILNAERTLEPDAIPKLQVTAAARGITLFAVKYVRQGSFPKETYADIEGLNLLVSSLGGVTIASSFEDLGEVTELIIRSLRQRYILSFPRPGNGSAGSHRLDITTKIKGVKLRSSAASAALLDNADGSSGLRQRPRYGTSKPQE